ARELLSRRELHALRRIGDQFSLRPLGRVDAPAEVVERCLRSLEDEGADGGVLSAGRAHLVGHLVRSSAMNCVRRFVGALIGGTSGGAARLRGRCRTATGLIYGM